MEEVQTGTRYVWHVSRGNAESVEWSGSCGDCCASGRDEVSNFEVERRTKDVQHANLQYVVDTKSLYDHLISLPSPSNVED